MPLIIWLGAVISLFRINRQINQIALEEAKQKSMQQQTDQSDGYLIVDTDGLGQVVLTHPALNVDENGIGRILFSVGQAQRFANSILRKAAEAEEQWMLRCSHRQ